MDDSIETQNLCFHKLFEVANMDTNDHDASLLRCHLETIMPTYALHAVEIGF